MMNRMMLVDRKMYSDFQENDVVDDGMDVCDDVCECDDDEVHKLRQLRMRMVVVAMLT